MSMAIFILMAFSVGEHYLAQPANDFEYSYTVLTL